MGSVLWDDVGALVVGELRTTDPLGTLDWVGRRWLPLRLRNEDDEDHDGPEPIAIFTGSSVPRPRSFLALVVLPLPAHAATGSGISHHAISIGGPDHSSLAPEDQDDAGGWPPQWPAAW